MKKNKLCVFFLNINLLEKQVNKKKNNILTKNNGQNINKKLYLHLKKLFTYYTYHINLDEYNLTIFSNIFNDLIQRR